jgi:MFS family permease
MLGADLTRGICVAVIGALSLGGILQLWHLIVLAGIYSVGTAFFAPAFDAIVPDILPVERLAQANSLDQFVRPIALRLAGPALGGVLITTFGVGSGFVFDAGSFAISAGCLLAMAPRPRRSGEATGSIGAELGAGFAYVRRHAWLWATLVSAAIAYLLFMGPTEVLVPFVVKNTLHGSAADLGLVFAEGGFGSVACAAAFAQQGLPKREITWMYVFWTLATLAIAGYGIVHALWGLMLASLAFNALETAGTIIWATAKQHRVPSSLLGRVSSLDWLISIGLMPLSYALTGPVSEAIGARGTLIGAGCVGAVVTMAALFIPGVRASDRGTDAAPDAAPALERVSAGIVR